MKCLFNEREADDLTIKYIDSIKALYNSIASYEVKYHVASQMSAFSIDTMEFYSELFGWKFKPDQFR